MKTFPQFVMETWLNDDFPNITEHEAELYIHSLLSIGKHFGNCTNDINSCLLCELTQLLNDYRDYTRIELNSRSVK